MHTPINASQFATVRETMRAGNKIDAIKLYRDYTGAGLADAKDAVEKIDEGMSLEALIRLTSPAPVVPVNVSIQPERMAWIHEALFKGNKIEAIKMYRDGTNLGLKESKQAMDKLEAELRQQSPDKFTAKAGKGCLGLIVGLGGLLAGVLVMAIIWIQR